MTVNGESSNDKNDELACENHELKANDRLQCRTQAYESSYKKD